MTAPREGRHKARPSSGVLQAFTATGRGQPGDEAPIFARALLSRADITENYSVHQDIS